MRAPVVAVVALVVAGSLLAADASADSASRPAPRTQLADAPCRGCRASFPVGSDPVPLLVLLHGDWGHTPASLLAAWEGHASANRIALLALQCPRELGCKGSFWQWNGDPAWVAAQVDALAKLRAIDRDRTWLAGWSGGASYVGLRAPELQRSFAALVYHGGGIPFGACDADRGAGTRHAPVYFLVGTANPLHHLAVRLRQHHESCNDEVVWKAIGGADHGAEWRALQEEGGAIVRWLLTKRARPAG